MSLDQKFTTQRLQWHISYPISKASDGDANAVRRLQTSIDNLEVVLSRLLAVRSRARQLGVADIDFRIRNLVDQSEDRAMCL